MTPEHQEEFDKYRRKTRNWLRWHVIVCFVLLSTQFLINWVIILPFFVNWIWFGLMTSWCSLFLVVMYYYNVKFRELLDRKKVVDG